MTRDELLERIFWTVNDWEFDAADHDDMDKIMRLVDKYTDEHCQSCDGHSCDGHSCEESYDRGVEDGSSLKGGVWER